MGLLAERLLVPVDVVVDSREAAKAGRIVEFLRSAGLELAVARLSAGDYYLLAEEGAKPLLVERKTVTDLLNSIRDNRLWNQLKLLKEAAQKEGVDLVIVLEGWLGSIEKYRSWRIQAVLRILDEVLLDWGVPILPSPNLQATAKWLLSKAKSLGRPEKKRPPRLRVEKKPMTPAERALYVAEGLAGPVLARRLLEYFGTLRRLANATVDELLRVEGIGEKRAKEIYEILNTPFEETRGSNRK